MQFSFLNKNILQYVTVIGLAVILLCAILLGYRSGQRKSASEAILANATQLTMALEYFYADQNRFPTADEFADKRVMELYMSGFPPREFPSTSCPQTYSYKRSKPGSYQLSICLPAAVSGLKAGWNASTVTK